MSSIFYFMRKTAKRTIKNQIKTMSALLQGNLCEIPFKTLRTQRNRISLFRISSNHKIHIRRPSNIQFKHLFAFFPLTAFIGLAPYPAAYAEENRADETPKVFRTHPADYDSARADSNHLLRQATVADGIQKSEDITEHDRKIFWQGVVIGLLVGMITARILR